MSGRPFARIYYVDLQRDYPDIWKDNDAHATYSRLLALADATWPVVPEVPRSEKRPHVQKLIDASLVSMCSEFGYRIKGFDAERSARSTKASIASGSRWGNAPSSASSSANGNAPGNALLQTRPTPVPSVGFIDPQKQSPEEYAAAVVDAQARRTGVKL